MNNHFGTAFGDADAVEDLGSELLADDELQRAAKANEDEANFALEFDKRLEDVMAKHYDRHEEFFDELAESDALERYFVGQMRKMIHTQLRAMEGQGACLTHLRQG